MNAVASTLTSDKPALVLNGTLSERLAVVNAASRKLHEHRVQIVGQDLRLGTSKRPVLFIAEPPPRAAGLRISRLDKRKDGTPVHVSRFDDVDVAWTIERAS